MAFDGDKKKDRSILAPAEDKLKDILIKFVPDFIETYHLTIVSLIWSFLIIVFGFLSRYNRLWLWGTSLMILLQYITDVLDGEIGRRRKTGLIRWGFYMDHFLDYIFICSLLIGYSFLVPNHSKVLFFFLLALFSGFMVSSYLYFASTNSFKITFFKLGPTEFRIFLIIVNIFLIYFNTTYILEKILPFFLIITTVGLFVYVYKTQEELWKTDMEILEKKAGRFASKVRRKREENAHNLRLVRNYIFSFILILAAFLSLYIRPFPKFYRGISFVFAAVAIGLNFITFFFLRKRYLDPSVISVYRRVLVYSIFFIFIGITCYVGFVLIPKPVNVKSREITDIIIVEKDIQSVSEIYNKINNIKSKKEINDKEYIKILKELDTLINRYDFFTEIDYLSYPDFHSKAFYVYFASRILKESLLLYLENTKNIHPHLKTKDRETPFKITSSLTYFNLIKHNLNLAANSFNLEREAGLVFESLSSVR